MTEKKGGKGDKYKFSWCLFSSQPNLNAAARLVHQPVQSDLKQLVVPFVSVVNV